MFKERLFQRAVTKTYISQTQITGKTVGGERFLQFFLLGRKVQIIHLITAHIIQALHLHFCGLQGRAKSHQSIYRCLKTAHQVLESHEHTSRHGTFHNGETTDGHNQRPVNTGKQCGQHLYRHSPQSCFLRGGQNLCLITGPFCEKV